MIYGISHNEADIYSQKILQARSDKGCLVSLATQFLKSITNRNLLRATFSMLFFFGPLKKGLVRFAGSMLRKRDLSAPSDLTKTHKRAICQNPGIL